MINYACSTHQIQNGDTSFGFLQKVFADGGNYDKYCPILDSVFKEAAGEVSAQQLGQLDLRKINAYIEEKDSNRNSEKNEIIYDSENITGLSACEPYIFKWVMYSTYVANLSTTQKIFRICDSLQVNKVHDYDMFLLEKYIAKLPFDSILDICYALAPDRNAPILRSLFFHPDFNNDKFETFFEKIISEKMLSFSQIDRFLRLSHTQERLTKFKEMEKLRNEIKKIYHANGVNVDTLNYLHHIFQK